MAKKAVENQKKSKTRPISIKLHKKISSRQDYILTLAVESKKGL